MAEFAASLDAEVRRVDEDRWLASRFAPREARERMIALYALNHELARTAEVVSDSNVGAIRLAWWREGVEEILAGGKPRAHATLEAFARAAADAPIDAAVLRALIEARGLDFDPAPFAAFSDMEAYVDATAGNLMRLAVRACGAAPDGDVAAFIRHAALAWGLTGLMRSEPYWRARGRQLMPGEGCSHQQLIARVRSAFEASRALAPSLPSEVFPAVGYAALAPGYLRALELGRGEPALLSRQLKLIVSAATGKI